MSIGFGEMKAIVEVLRASASAISAAPVIPFTEEKLHTWIEIVVEPITALATIALAWIAGYQLGSAKDTIKSTFESSRTVMTHNGLVNQVLKSIDVSMHCATRYDSLNDMRAAIVKLQKQVETKEDELDARKRAADGVRDQGSAALETLKAELEGLKSSALSSTKDYYGRFWALKSDQFDFWLAGVLDHDSFFDWSFYLVVKIIRESQSAKDSGNSIDQLPISLAKSWEQWSRYQQSERGDGGAGSNLEINHGGSNPGFVAFTDVLFGLAYKLVQVRDGTEIHLWPHGAVNAPQSKLWPHDALADSAVAVQSRNFTIAQAVLQIIKKLENEGAAHYRKLLWTGKVDFDTFYKMMMESLGARHHPPS